MIERKFKRVLLVSSILVIAVFSAEFHADDLGVKSDPTPKEKSDKPLAEKPAKKTTVDYSAKISHVTHINFIEDCNDCHVFDDKSDLHTLNKKLCDKCHDEQGTPTWEIPGAARKMKKITFQHNLHTRDAECDTCHQTTMNDKHKKDTPLVAPESCVSCHAKEKVTIPERNCVRCHGVEKNRTAPPSHKKTWLRRHGREERWKPNRGHGEECLVCHNNASCVACHRIERPLNHNGLWRLRMHGTAAKWDRSRCKTCHETGACVSCHRRTPPQDHRGAWGSIHGLSAVSRSNDRCTTCHNPAWCADCHRRSSR